MSKAEIAEDEAVLWKSDTVSLGDDKILFLIYYYHTVKGNYKNSWYKCSVRIDSKENWNNLRKNILNDNPADFFRFKDIGMDHNYRLYYAKKHMIKTDVYRFLNLKFSEKRIKNLDDFIKEQEEMKNTVAVYPKEYDNMNLFTDTSKFEIGKWYHAPRVKISQKKMKIVY